MVSEAVSSGKAVLVFMPDKKHADETKYERFVKQLEKDGHLKIVEPRRILDEVKEAISRRASISVPQDNERIREKLYKLF